jgi:hypothetical protein
VGDRPERAARELDVAPRRLNVAARPLSGGPPDHDALVDRLVEQRRRDHERVDRHRHDGVAAGQWDQEPAAAPCDGRPDHEDDAEPGGGEAHRDRRVVRAAPEQQRAGRERGEGNQRRRRGGARR